MLGGIPRRTRCLQALACLLAHVLQLYELLACWRVIPCHSPKESTSASLESTVQLLLAMVEIAPRLIPYEVGVVGQ